MKSPVPLLLTGFAIFGAACSSPVDLEPAESCVGESGSARAAFEDPGLESSVKQALGLDAGSELTCRDVSFVTELDASDAGITSLVGIQNLINLRLLDLTGNTLDDLSPLSELRILSTLFARSSGITSVSGLQGLQGITFLDLSDNSIAGIGPLSGLTSLDFLDLTGNQVSNVGALSGLTNLIFLYLDDNQVSDVGPLSGLLSVRALRLGNNSLVEIGPLSGLTSVSTLYLDANDITDVTALGGLTGLALVDLSENDSLSDIQPLLDNGGLGDGDIVNLRFTAVSCPTVNALRAKGVIVDSGCPPVGG
jgi:Leucine-rich repeat (LRR) protein